MTRRTFLTTAIIISVFIILSAAPAMAAWPTQSEWVPILGSDWANITDPLDETSNYLDCIVDTSQPADRRAATYFYFDGTNVYFRLILDGNPLKYQGGNPVGMRPFGWAVSIESTGDLFPDFAVDIDGTGSADKIHTMYNLDLDYTVGDETGWLQPATALVNQDGFIYLMNMMARSKQVVTSTPYNADPDFYLDFYVPLSWLSRAAGPPPSPITPTTPIKIALGTDASGQNIKKDLVGQSATTDLATYFANTPTLTFGGSYGTLLDGRHNASVANSGTWALGETLTIYGSSWPTLGQPVYTGYIQVRIYYPNGITYYQVPAPGVATTTAGVVNLQSAWSIPLAAPLGIYTIKVEQPNSGAEQWMDKDTFNVVAGAPSASIIKEVSPDGTNWAAADSVPGPYYLSTVDPVHFRITVTNTGYEPINSFSVTDTAYSVTGEPTTLPLDDPGTIGISENVYTYTYTLPWAAGQMSNTASFSGTSAYTSTPLSGSNSAHYFGAMPSVSVEKQVYNGSTWVDADTATGPYLLNSINPVQFRVIISNNGNEPLSSLSVADAVTVVLPASTLAVGASMTSATYSMPWTAGQQLNTATVVGTSNWTSSLVTDDDAAYYYGAFPSVSIEKQVYDGSVWMNADTASGPYLLNSINPVQFRVTVTNNGNEPLSALAVADEVTVVLPGSTLAAGASMTSSTYTMPWTAGQQSNTATVTGTSDWTTSPVTANDMAYYFGAIPSVSIEKQVYDGSTWVNADTATGPYLLNAINPVQFRVTVTNNGNEPLSSLSVADEVPVVLPVSALAAGASTTSATYTMPWTAGQQLNTATVIGTSDLTASHVTASDMAYYFGAEPSVSIEKQVYDGSTWVDADTATGPYLLNAINPVQFRVTVTNNGNEPLSSLSVADEVTVVLPGSTLAAGATMSSSTYTMPWTAGQQSNTATVTGTSDWTSSPVTANDMAYYYGAIPSVNIEKQVYDGSTWVNADTATGPYLLNTINPVQFRVTVTNNGNEPLSSLSVADEVAVVLPGSTLAVGATMTSSTYAMPWTAGQQSNTAIVTCNSDLTSSPVTANDMAYYYGAVPSVSIEKQVYDGSTWVNADTSTGPYLLTAINPVQFRVTVTNNGNEPLSSLSVADEVTVVLPDSTLAAGASMVSSTYTMPWTSGQQSNTATVSGTSDLTSSPVTANDAAFYFGALPSVSIEKQVYDGSAWVDADTATGPYLPNSIDPVQFRVTITNNGNEPLSSLSVADGVAVALPGSTLAAGASIVSSTYTMPWTAGQQSNTATVAGTSDWTTSLVTDHDMAYYYGTTPSVSIEKQVYDGSAWVDADSAAGPYLLSTTDPVQFRVTLTNNGSEPLSSLSVTDEVAVTMPGSALAVGASMTSSVYTMPWAVGQQSNTASVTGTSDWTASPVAGTDMAYYYGATVLMTIEKQVFDGSSWQDADTAPGPYLLSTIDPVNFRIIVTNVGNEPVMGITFADTDTLPFNIIANLFPGDVLTINLNRDWEPGQHVNTASFSGTSLNTGVPVSGSDSAYYFGAVPSATIIKEVSPDGTNWVAADALPGPYYLSTINPVHFRITVTNTGAEPINSFSVSDTDYSITGEPATLPLDDPGTVGISENVYTYTYTLPWAAGQLSNTASFSGTSAYTSTPLSGSDSANYYGAQPSVSVEKQVYDGSTWVDADTATGPYLLSGINPVQFRVTITNNGNEPLSSISVADEATVVLPGSTLAVGASMTSSTYTMPWTAGQQSNTATVIGTSDWTATPVHEHDMAHYYGSAPSVGIEKQVFNGSAWVDADAATGPYLQNSIDPVQFRVTITNNGNEPLSSLFVADEVAVVLPGSALAVGASMTSSIYTMPWAAGQQSNNALVSGYSDWTLSPVMANDMAYYFGAMPSISIEKQVYDGSTWVNADTATGPYLLNSINPVQFRVAVTNNGNEPISALSVADEVPVVLPGSALAVGASMTSSIYTMPWAAGQQSNTATVTGTSDLTSSPVSANDMAYYYGAMPSVSIEKQVYNGSAWENADTATGPYLLNGIDPVQFRVTVTNNGNEPLSALLVADEVAVVLPGSTLATGASMTSSTYTMPWAVGQQSNSATVTGTSSWTASPVTANDMAYYFGAMPSVSIEKQVHDGSTWVNADTATGPYLLSTINPVHFRVIITNDGNEPLSSLSVADEVGVVLPGSFLAAGASMTSSTYTMPWTAGQQLNTATVIGNSDWTSSLVTEQDSAYYYGAQPSVSIEKQVFNGSAWVDADTATGPYLLNSIDPVQFRVTITNIGNEPLSSLSVADEVTVVLPGSALAAGASMTSSIYTMPWAAGQQSNTATVTGTSGWTSSPVTASDMAHYFGAAPLVSIEKQIFNGSIWVDADTATGPYLLSSIDPVQYRVIITNNGNEPLSSLSVADEATVVLPGSTLAVGASMTSAIYTMPWAAGQQSNTATVISTSDWTSSFVHEHDMAYYYGALPSVSIEKQVYNGSTWVNADTATGPYLLSSNNPVQFRVTVTNNGNEPLSALSVADEVAVVLPGSTLAAGSSMTSSIYTMPWAAGQQSNTATVTGTSNWTSSPVTATDMAYYFGAIPSVSIEKQVYNGSAWVDADAATGPYLLSTIDPVQFRVTVTNNGNEPLNTISVTDEVAVVLPGNALAAGESMVSSTYTMPWAAGQQSNTATVIGASDWTSSPVTSSDKAYYFGVVFDTPGLVYDASNLAPIPGAEVTLVYATGPNAGMPVILPMAPHPLDTNQDNPAFTDAMGNYIFFALDGEYRILVTAFGYEDYMSGAFTLTEPITAINLHIPMMLVESDEFVIAKVSSREVAAPGERIMFTLTWSNTSGGPISDVKLVDLLPATVTVEEASISGAGIYDSLLHSITWSYGNIDASAEVHTETFYAVIDEELEDGTLMLNRAEVSGRGGSRATASVVVLVARKPGIEVYKEAGDASASTGDIVTYKVHIINRADSPTPMTAYDVIVKDELPLGFSYIPGTSHLDGIQVADPSIAGSELSWPIGDMEVEDSHVLTYKVAIGIGALNGDGINYAIVTGQGELGYPFEVGPASARVMIVGPAFSPLGSIIGKVFSDKDADGIQDTGEEGIANAEVIMDDGMSARTDDEGQYHIGQVKPGVRSIKINMGSLPKGAVLTNSFKDITGISASFFVDVLPSGVARADFAVGVPDGAKADEVRQGGSEPLLIAGTIELTHNASRFENSYIRARAFLMKRFEGGSLVLRYDTEQGVADGLYSDASDDAMYSLYGDSSSTVNLAPSSSPFYAKLDSKYFDIAWSDFQPAFESVELSSFMTKMTGGQVAINVGGFSLEGFVAPTRAGMQTNRMAGNGTSGYFFLDDYPVVTGSETVYVIRTRFYDESIVLDRKPLMRNLDYKIDYTTGSILLTDAMPSYDEEGNKYFLEVTYSSTGGEYDGLAAGIRAHADFGAFDLGATTAISNKGGTVEAVVGADMGLDLGEAFSFDAEGAVSFASGAYRGYAIKAGASSRIGKVELKVEAGVSDGGFIKPGETTTMPRQITLYGSAGIDPAEALILSLTSNNAWKGLDYSFSSENKLTAGYRLPLKFGIALGMITSFTYTETPETKGAIFDAFAEIAPIPQLVIKAFAQIAKVGDPIDTDGDYSLSISYKPDTKLAVTLAYMTGINVVERYHTISLAADLAVTEKGRIYGKLSLPFGSRAANVLSLGYNDSYQLIKGLVVSFSTEGSLSLGGPEIIVPGSAKVAASASLEYVAKSGFRAYLKQELTYGSAGLTSLTMLNLNGNATNWLSIEGSAAAYFGNSPTREGLPLTAEAGLSLAIRPDNTVITGLLKANTKYFTGEVFEEPVMALITTATTDWTLEAGKYLSVTAKAGYKLAAEGAAIDALALNHTMLLQLGASLHITRTTDVEAFIRAIGWADNWKLGYSVQVVQKIFNLFSVGIGYNSKDLSDTDIVDQKPWSEGFYIKAMFKF